METDNNTEEFKPFALLYFLLICTGTPPCSGLAGFKVSTFYTEAGFRELQKGV